jgi:hypothetical protein
MVNKLAAAIAEIRVFFISTSTPVGGESFRVC